METKQVIVMRRYFPDPKDPTKVRKIRLGKQIAQACHASMSFLTKEADLSVETLRADWVVRSLHVSLTEPQKEWLEDSFKKIVCYVDTELEIHGLAALAKEHEIEAHVITDSGYTEFDSPTVTCIALGPDYSNKIDRITKDLPLL